MRLTRILTFALCFSVAPPLTSTPRLSAQEGARYSDTTADFQRFLQEILDATKNGDKQRVASLLKSTEVPNCDAWLHQMYESDKADSWMSLCEAKTLAAKEKSMTELFAGFAKRDGEFSIRKVNDDPHGGEGGLEYGMVHAGKAPLEVYVASWKPAGQPKEATGESIGYFYYLDGGFRWDSLVTVIKPRITNAKVVGAKLIKRVEPVYAPDAAAQHITGTVRVYYVIGADGAVYNAHALSGEGLSEDPLLRKAAEEAVLQWGYKPATWDGKPIQTNAVTVDLIFGQKN